MAQINKMSNSWWEMTSLSPENKSVLVLSVYLTKQNIP